MIKLTDAFGTDTTAPAEMYVQLEGYWDQDNQWVEGGYAPAITIQAAMLPTGDKSTGTHGQIVQAKKYGERYPAIMKFHSLTELPLNALIVHNDITYKLTKKGDYKAANFWASVGQTLNKLNITHHEITIQAFGEDEPLLTLPIVESTDPTLETVFLSHRGKDVSIADFLRVQRRMQ